VLKQNETVTLEDGVVRLKNQSPQSVRVIKLIDKSVAEAAPTVTAQAPAAANTGETINLSAQAEAGGVPAVAYHWDLGDGTSADKKQDSSARHRKSSISELAVDSGALRTSDIESSVDALVG
jgi:hypothetical protein